MPKRASNQLPIRAPIIPMQISAMIAEAGAAHDLSGEPAGNETDQQNDEKTFPRHGDTPVRRGRPAAGLCAPDVARAKTGTQWLAAPVPAYFFGGLKYRKSGGG
jgi:hypothetical protein